MIRAPLLGVCLKEMEMKRYARGATRNPVAKHVNTYNRAATHVDRKKAAKGGTARYPSGWDETAY